MLINTKIPLYSLCLLCGIVLFLLFFYLHIRRTEKKINTMLFLIIYLGVIFFAIGTSLYDSFVHYLNGEKFGDGGMSYLGGVVLSFPVVYHLLRTCYGNKMASRDIINGIIPSLVIAHSFGRLGCFFGGCCYGKPTESILGIIYPAGSRAAEMYGVGTRLIPTQLIESVYLLILFFVFFFLIKERRFVWYCFLYGIYRFFAEYMRGDNRGTFLPFLTPAQFLSIVLIITGIIILIIQRKHGDDGLVHKDEIILHNRKRKFKKEL